MSIAANVGIIGCGNISATYMRMAAFFCDYQVVACADLDMRAAEARAAEFGLRPMSIADLLRDPEIQIVLNLTTPNAHFDVSSAALAAGKHVYSEKPFVLTSGEADTLATMAKTKGLRIGSAPDTFMGGSHQKARELIEAGTIGRIVSGTIHVMSAGMEHWHPNPDFFFLPGAGPVLDLAPYYITNLVQLLGPVAQVVAMSSSPNTHRTIGSGPRAGEAIPVKTPTTVHALLRFANGTVISYGTSWDVKSHQHSHMELYGESGTLYVPDPNFFGGALHLATTDAEPTKQVIDHPLSKPNDGDFSNYRGVGLADMAAAIRKNRPHRCNNDLAAHVVEVMNAILNSGDTAHPIDIQSGCARPAPLSSEEAFALLSNRTV